MRLLLFNIDLNNVDKREKIGDSKICRSLLLTSLYQITLDQGLWKKKFNLFRISVPLLHFRIEV